MTEQTIEFKGFPKIARLNRIITVTEKLDGTNAAVIIQEAEGDLNIAMENTPAGSVAVATTGSGAPDFEGSSVFYVAAQSRNRLITPEDDNFGFAKWVRSNAVALVDVLGEGYHFGEWWGSGIQRGYDLPKGEKRFSLFNTKRWSEDADWGIDGLSVVPVLYQGGYSQAAIDYQINGLRSNGSVASPGFMDPEGIVVYHVAANQMFKVTLSGDEAPKSAQAAA